MWILYYKSPTDDIDATCIADWLEQLPAGKREALQRRVHTEHQILSLIGWQLLRYGMQQVGNTDFSLQQIEFPEHEKPHLPGPWDFNISHSGQLVACAFTRQGHIGIDVERQRDVEPQRFARYFSSDELAWMGDDAERFVDLWTRKEAVIKASGIGLKGLSRVTTQHDMTAHDGQHAWYLHKLALAKNYTCHVATDDPHAKIESQQEVSIEKLRGN